MFREWIVPIENGAILLAVAVVTPIILGKLNLIHTTVNSNYAAEVVENANLRNQIGTLQAVSAATAVREAALIEALAAATGKGKHE